MTDRECKKQIADEWFDKAFDALESARCLFRENHFTGCINRMYYAVFYAVCALLAKEGTEYGKHSAVRAALHRDYIKTKNLPYSCGKIYDRLFEERQLGDYTIRKSFSRDDVETLLKDSSSFLDCIKSRLS